MTGKEPEIGTGCPELSLSLESSSHSRRCCCSVKKSCPTLQSHGLQHARLPCPSASPGVCSNSRPLSQWRYLTISFSVAPFSSCPQSLAASRSFLTSWLLPSGGQSIGVSAPAHTWHFINLLGWSKSSFGFFCKILRENANELFGQPNISYSVQLGPFYLTSVKCTDTIWYCLRKCWVSPVAQQWKIHLQCRRHGLNSWVEKIPWRRKRQPTPVFLPGKSHGQRSLVDYSPWGCKELDRTESDTT